MSMFPHTVTLYNVSTELDTSTMKDVLVNHITVLRGVLMEASKAVNVRASGLDSADAVNLYIPFDVDAVDGETGAEKAYVGPVEFIVKGEVVEPDLDYQGIAFKYDNVYQVTKVDRMDFGGLAHFEVGAN